MCVSADELKKAKTVKFLKKYQLHAEKLLFHGRTLCLKIGYDVLLWRAG